MLIAFNNCTLQQIDAASTGSERIFRQLNMVQVFLHIGQTKTGTTSIQGCLHKNRKMLLAKYKTLYPDTLKSKRRKIHTDLVLLTKDRRGIENLPPSNRSILRRYMLRRGVTDIGSLERFSINSRKNFFSEVANKKPDSIILSSELIWLFVTKHEEISRLFELLKNIANEITVVVYLRRQDEHIISSSSAAIKLGNPGNKALENAATNIFPYLEHLDAWSEVFGLDRVVVRVFERGQLQGRDVITDFLSIVGIPDQNIARAERENEKLDTRKIKILKGVFPGKSLRGDFSKKELSQWRRLMMRLEKMEPLGPPIRMPDDVRQRVLANHAEMNKEIARKYLGRDDGQLFSPLGSQENHSNSNTTPVLETTLKVIRALLSDPN